MNFFKKYFAYLIALSFIFVFFSCEDDFQADASGNVLVFSNDTLTFDTVFTKIGSATSKILVYNKRSSSLSISNIRLAGGSGSTFRINVGRISSTNAFENIVIRGKDSLYIFVEVNLNPNDVNTPVLVQDSIMFTVDNKMQRVLLEAYGQDVEVFRGKVITTDTILSANKPYLVYDSLRVNPDVTLTLPEGTVVYFHHNANLLVYGNLRATGTFDHPIVMRGDRLDKIQFPKLIDLPPIPYKYVSGQWGGVYLLSKTGNHLLNHVHMSSGYVGLYFYNEDRSYKPSLEINNSRIHNFLLYNLVAVNGDLLVTNSEISNSGSYTVYLNGGKHAFYHCTITNYFNNNRAQPISRDANPAVMLMDLNKPLPMETIFKNCIISGSAGNEFTLASKFQQQYRGDIQHSYIRKPKASDLPLFSDIRWSQQTDTIIFKNIKFNYEKNQYFDFTPDSISPARGLANPVIAAQYPLDLSGKSRLEDGEPDAGAYEWYPTTIQ
ncbi:MAG: hypothetical protein Q7J05_04920 [Paludibacter sp.]|nr:hypothetical protein [Paludibacter sp.]